MSTRIKTFRRQMGAACAHDLLRRVSLGILFVVLAGMSAGPEHAAGAAERPNIILIQSDDHPADLFGFGGQAEIKTPHLDRLAAAGVYFSRCYVPTPQDGPSQACLLTGQYPHTHGVVSDGQTLGPYAETCPARLKEAGYACGFIGKWSLLGERPGQPGYGLLDFTAVDEPPGPGSERSVWLQGRQQKVDKYLIDWHTEQAIEFVDKFKEKPFFLWLCFPAPREPFEYPPGNASLDPPADLKLPAEAEIGNLPGILRNSSLSGDFKKNKAALAAMRSKCRAMITRLDDNIGRLLQRIDELKLAERTVVIFVPENGFLLGEHELYGKGNILVDELVRVPLVIRYPARVPPGGQIERVVSLIDLAATLCALADLAPPVRIQGQTLLPLIANPQTPQADERFLEFEKENSRDCPARGVVTGQFKFIDYLKDSDVLFDLTRDPHERTNVFREPQYAAVGKVLSKRLEQWRKATRDTGK